MAKSNADQGSDQSGSTEIICAECLKLLLSESAKPFDIYVKSAFALLPAESRASLPTGERGRLLCYAAHTVKH